ncbi:MAG: putative metal-binding motif-containing protein [Myxococcota bacterium]|nr:putative metal-binding motif-containing protein [Myxococcota bacterium]
MMLTPTPPARSNAADRLRPAARCANVDANRRAVHRLVPRRRGLSSLTRGALLSAIVLACEPEATQLRWLYRFASPTTEARAVHVRARLHDMACPSSPEDAPEARFETSFPRNDPRQARAPGRLQPGRYGFEVRALGTHCELVAWGCSEASVPASGHVEVLLEDATAPGCDPDQTCLRGECLRVRDAGIDTSPRDAPSDEPDQPIPPDAGDASDASDDAHLFDASDASDAPTDALPDRCVPRPETCDGRDEDCNGIPDDGADRDADGVPQSCDCDDGDPTRAPGRPERCDGVDSDCDGAERLDCCPIGYALRRLREIWRCVSGPRGPATYRSAVTDCDREGGDLADVRYLEGRPCGTAWFRRSLNDVHCVDRRGQDILACNDGGVPAWLGCEAMSCTGVPPPACEQYYWCEQPPSP